MRLFGIMLALIGWGLPAMGGDEMPRIAIIDSATPTAALLARPGTYLGETFTFSETQSGDVHIQVGVWEAGEGLLNLHEFPFTEYVLMISGSVIVTELDGTAMMFSAGDTFVIPKGWSGSWDVQERMKKQIVRIGAAQQ
ncbi:MAG: cupin domain-containing protein [Pikeienuella sp.]